MVTSTPSDLSDTSSVTHFLRPQTEPPDKSRHPPYPCGKGGVPGVLLALSALHIRHLCPKGLLIWCLIPEPEVTHLVRASSWTGPAVWLFFTGLHLQGGGAQKHTHTHTKNYVPLLAQFPSSSKSPWEACHLKPGKEEARKLGFRGTDLTSATWVYPYQVGSPRSWDSLPHGVTIKC